MNPIDILREDYSQTLGIIDKCDDHIFKIKNWALVTSSAIIAFSISQDKEAIALLNLPLLVAFIYLELIYKSFQDSAIEHSTDVSERIDRYLEDQSATELLEEYYHGFGRKLKYPAIGHVFSLIFNPTRRHVFNFYILLCIFSIAAFMFGNRIA